MVKRKFTTLMSLCVAALALSTNVRAESPFAGADGCAVLAQLVYSEVTAAAWQIPGFTRPSSSNAPRTDISICNRTTQTVSQAFTMAMASIGSPIRWPSPPVDRGDFCLSIFLDQCYPRRSELGADIFTWNALSSTIAYAMPDGAASDRSVFSEGALQMALRTALLHGRHVP